MNKRSQTAIDKAIKTARGAMKVMRALSPQPSARGRDGRGETRTLQMRQAGEFDLPRLLQLFVEAGINQTEETDPVLAIATLRRIHGAGGEIWLAEERDRLLGSLTFYLLPLLAHRGTPIALVEEVVIHPAARRHGIGRALMNHATLRARACGASKLALSSGHARSGAQSFFDHLGYARHGNSPLLPQDTPEHSPG
jgi:GNAT superfamily N-acetyltransferase